MALHGNGNRKDNRIENLRWGFALDNTDDRESDGKTARAERNGNAKLDWEEVDAIRQERSTKSTSFQNLADKFGVSKKTVMNIVHNKTWVKEKYKDG
jgi:DNA-binding XRE family transcriptional regulator